jgi:excisionase family DNA binding protein
MSDDKSDSPCSDEGTTNTSVLSEVSDKEVPTALIEDPESYIDSRIESALQDRKERATEPPLWSIQQVADYLNIGVRTVEKEISADRISPVWVRGQRRFEKGHIKKYVRRNTG